MDITFSNTISPIDNRYFNLISELSNFYSYKSWVNYRLNVESKYLILLLNIFNNNDIFKIYNINNKDNKDNKDITKDVINKLSTQLNNHSLSFNDNNLKKIIYIEKKTLHDIKAIEYYLKDIITNDYLPNILNNLDINLNKQIDIIKQITEYIHFGLTSQDVNSVAFTSQTSECMKHIIIPNMNLIIQNINNLSEKSNITIMAYTHGQPAVPTNMMKELQVFITRLNYWFTDIKTHKHSTKFGGAVGNLNAHYYTYPNIKWNDIFTEYLNKEGINRWEYTTQITNYDDICKLFGFIIGFNTVLIDLCQDIWLYVSNNYFKLHKENDTQVGSSTMPQKVNPIDFENAEGNLKLANSGFHFFIDKLQVSRLQRDLTDSTILRNIGTYFAYSLIGYKKIIKGLNKLEINKKEINNDLNKHPEILAEAIQIILRTYNISNAYDIVRKITQNKDYKNLEEFKNEVKINIYNYIFNKDTKTKIERQIDNLNFDSYSGKF